MQAAEFLYGYTAVDRHHTAPAGYSGDRADGVLVGSIAVDSISAPTTFTVTQFVMGSLWADRIKLGTTTAKYYYARI